MSGWVSACVDRPGPLRSIVLSRPRDVAGETSMRLIHPASAARGAGVARGLACRPAGLNEVQASCAACPGPNTLVFLDRVDIRRSGGVHLEARILLIPSEGRWS